MERSYDNPPLNSTQISYHVRSEVDKRTGVSPSQRMPLIRLPAGSPLFSPGPRSPMFQPSPSFFPFSSLTLSPSSLFHRHGSSSTPVKNIDSSIGFNNNPSLPPMMSPSTGFDNNHFLPLTSPTSRLKNNPSLPPIIPSMRSNPVRVSDNTLQPRKAHKRSKSDIPLNYPELNDPKPLEHLIGESSRGKEGVSEMKSDEEFEKKFNFNAFINSEFNDFIFNENNDEIFINIDDTEDANSAIGSRSNTGSTSSGVKRGACQESEILSKHYRSGSLDSYFNELVKKPPLPLVKRRARQESTSLGIRRREGQKAEILSKHYISGSIDSDFDEVVKKPPLPCKVSSINLVHGNDITGSYSKHADRMLANRQAAARSKKKKNRHIADLEYSERTLNRDINTFSGQLAFYEKKRSALLTENEELKIQTESMKQHAKLRDAMNKQLNAEVKRLNMAIALNQQLSAEVQRINAATAIDEQLSAQVQQLNLTTREVMQNLSDFERSNMQPMNGNMLKQVNFNEYSKPYLHFNYSNQQM